MKQQYDSYKPSGIVWIGEIPSHWEIVKLSHAISKIADIDHYMPDSVENGYPYLMIGDLKARCSDIDFKNCKQISEEDYIALSKKIRPLKGDLILARYASIGNVSYVDINSEFVVSYGCLTIQTRKDFMNSKYLFHIIKSDQFANESNQYINSNTQGNLGLDSLTKIKIVLPPLAEQEGIAAWLDEKCEEIDAAIAKVDREIELIDELKQSEISRVVTRGLNPNAPLRSSDIDWIGDIPKHWEIAPLKFKCSLKGRIGWNGLKSDEFKESAYAYLVTGQDFRGADIDWSKCYQIDKWRYDEDPFIQLENGDILITKDGTIGKIAKVSGLDKPACLNSGIFVMKQLGEFFSQQYLYWVLVSPQLLAFNNYVAGQGTTIQHLYQNVFENMPLLVPPLSEQHEIADYLDKKCAEIDGLKAKLKMKRDALTELRQSLISEVVTGKRKVV